MRRLFWDIETTPNVVLSWRLGNRIALNHDNLLEERRIILIGYKWQDEDEAHVLTWNRRQDDRGMIKKFIQIANTADELVAHNGDKFDLRWLNTRSAAHNLDPLVLPKTVDTLAIARRRFYFNSNKLDYIGKFLLGEGKRQTDFGLWRRILKGDLDALQEMADYCKQDVYLLERVYHTLMGYHTPKSHEGVMEGRPKWSCPHCGIMDNIEPAKKRTTGRGTVQWDMLCHDCNTPFRISDTAYKEYMAYEFV